MARRPSTPSRTQALGLPVDVRVGSLDDAVGLEASLQGCDYLFHVAADYRIWVPDPAAISSLFSFLPTAGRNKDGGLLLALWLATPAGARAYEEATGRGNYLIEGTETSRLLAGRTIAEFTPDQTERMLPILTRFNTMLATGGGREVD